VDAVEMLLRATATLRELRTSPDGNRIRACSTPPLSSASQ